MSGPLVRRRALRLLPAACLTALALLAAACGSDADTSAALAGWASGASYRSTLSLLGTDVSEIRAGIARRELVPTRTACDGLGSDAASAIGELPTPDRRLTDLLNGYYSDLVNAAQSCSEARSLAPSQLARFERQLAAAEVQLAAASRRYATLARG